MTQRLDPQTFGATVDALGKGKQAKAFAAAGALQPVAPDIAESVIRGQALLAANPLLAPKETDDNRLAIDATLPAKIFVPGLEGPRQELLEAARLRYADLSAQVGDTSGEYSDERMKQSVSDVVGGTVTFNGEALIAPTYRMSQDEFDRRVAALTDDDLRGAIAADGTQITASDFRRYYRLKSVGDGEYAISYGGAGVPQFLLRAADPRSHSQRAFEGFFILDLGA